MSLDEYKQKRDFNHTDEPQAEESSSDGELKFSVQRHDASNLHYDLRLEMEGVLKSWAIPKGPSMNSEDKRLAIHTEDHPFDYLTFEGTIEEGNYGAGTVELWDLGTYQSTKSDEDQAEETLLEELEDGSLKIKFNGQKLNGAFALVNMKNQEEDQWLLIKKDDKDAVDENYDSEEYLEEVKKSKKSQQKNPTESAMPHNIKPMLTRLVDEPFDDEGWLFEIKWDGYRAIAEYEDGKVDLYSRNGQSFNIKYEPVAEALSNLSKNAILDGEIVMLDEDGHADFQRLQNIENNEEGDLCYYVFDLLRFDGHDLTDKPLNERKDLLEEVMTDLDDSRIRYSDHVAGEGISFFEKAKSSGLEGIIGKKKDSRYKAGKRSGNWVKIKAENEQEAVIGGFTEPRGSRKHFGSLVLGVYENNDLQYIGQCGTGFSDESLEKLSKKFDPLITDASPFTNKNIDLNTPATWLEPELVCEVKFSEWTNDGLMRHPVFKGLRVDKEAENVNREDSATDHSKSKKDMDENQKEETIHVKGHELKLTNLDKVFWPDAGYTKGDVIEYYREISDVILPYLKKRPQSMLRQPDGINGDGFFQKDMKDQPPEWVDTIKIESESKDKKINYALCNNKSSLTWMNQLGCIEINPWLSRTTKLDKPDYCTIDIDPDDNSYDEVIEAAQAVKKVLDNANADGYPKTSGATGMHIYIPLNGKYSYDQSKDFAKLIATLAHKELPDLTNLNRNPDKRANQIYLDYLQNSPGQTLAAPYSLRPEPDATVSTPLEWDEVKEGLTPKSFTIKNMQDRLEKKGDLFGSVRGKGIDMEQCIENLE